MIWLWLYLIGGFAFWIVAFRVMASDPIMGVPASDTRHDAVGAILLAGFISLVMTIFWPLVGLIFLVWKFAIAPVIKPKANQ